MSKPDQLPRTAEFLESKPIQPWAKTNHSDPETYYDPDCLAAEPALADTITQQFPTVGDVQQLFSLRDSAGGNRHYRVVGSQRTVFARCFRPQWSAAALSALHDIYRAVATSDIFFDSPQRGCLVPLRSNNGQDAVGSVGQLMTLYPHAEEPNLRHYAGSSLAELASAAERYGRLHVGLQQLQGLDFKALANTSDRLVWQPFDPRLFATVEAAASDNPANPGAVLFRKYRSLIEGALAVILTVTQPSRPPEVVHHDFHPHNTFFVGDDCRLIYDYETVSMSKQFPEALAFGLHRFVREVVRNGVASVEQGKECFLTGFTQGGGSVPSEIDSHLAALITKPNLHKLLSVLSQQLGQQPDLRGRTVKERSSEAHKFLGYLMEAQAFAQH
ncbi:MAG: hypothetical protein ACD_41C00091G0011 [uncultured bacterium]|nr:MAG: hypothetical protein ACD_41C00091G0011 [uncultured bacterium]HBY73430.1 hypothetical protein [Candidatus Kerfeldbacteria bacterium]